MVKSGEFVTRCSNYLWDMGGYSIDLIIDITVAGRFHENGFSCFIAAE